MKEDKGAIIQHSQQRQCTLLNHCNWSSRPSEGALIWKKFWNQSSIQRGTKDPIYPPLQGGYFVLLLVKKDFHKSATSSVFVVLFKC